MSVGTASHHKAKEPERDELSETSRRKRNPKDVQNTGLRRANHSRTLEQILGHAHGRWVAFFSIPDLNSRATELSQPYLEINGGGGVNDETQSSTADQLIIILTVLAPRKQLLK